MKSVAGFKVHPAANIFPLIEGDEFDALVQDIKANGLREKVVLFEGKILDGRNRARACKKAKVDLQARTYRGQDPYGYVASLNLKRRHLNESQRAMAAARLADATHGGDRRSSGKSAARTQAEAAKELAISERSVRSAVRIQKKGTPELVQAVDQGRISVTMGEQLLKKPSSDQRAIAQQALDGEDPKRALRESNRKERVKKMRQISAGNTPLKTDTKFGLIYADPAWQYESGTTTPSRVIENQYPTMPLEDIVALPVRKLGLKHSVLALWIPSPLLLTHGPPVVKGWGYTYKTNYIWEKKGGPRCTGYYAEVRHEHLLICTRGDVPPPPVPARFPSVQLLPRPRGHSRKPARFAEMLELMYPEASKIELFCRSPRKGWSAWGNQANGDEE